MGIQERKTRHRQELKELIMNAAATLFRTKGIDNTSMRAIAKAIEYSPGTIYLHFDNKDDLLFEVSKRGFELFFRHLNTINDIEDPFERLTKMGEEYISFAMEYPSYYALMFIMDDPMRSIEKFEEWKGGQTSHDVLTGIISDCQQAGYFEGYGLEQLSLMIWGQVHGMVSLRIRNRLGMYKADNLDQSLSGALAIFMGALERM